MVEMDANLREERHEGRFALIIRPMIPMKMGHRHAVVIEQGVEDVQGNDIPESLGFVHSATSFQLTMPCSKPIMTTNRSSSSLMSRI